jgi:hypothetical protein
MTEGRWDRTGVDYARQTELAKEAKRRGIPEFQLEMSRAVDDATIRSLVDDFRRGPSQRSSLVTPKVEIERRVTSTSEPVPLTVPGLRWIDQQCDVADAIARRRRARELAGLEPDDAA